MIEVLFDLPWWLREGGMEPEIRLRDFLPGPGQRW